MDLSLVEKIADAVLYEGYMLYPYRASSVKNRQRFNWGALAPKAYSDAQRGTEAWEMLSECLVAGDRNAGIKVRVRFLHLTNREIGKIEHPSSSIPEQFDLVAMHEVDGQIYQAWQEVVERSVELPVLKPGGAAATQKFSFPGGRETEPIRDASGRIAALIIRERAGIDGEIEASIDTSPGPGITKLSVRIRNTTPFENAAAETRESALLRSLVSTHAILSVEGGEFVSLLEPTDELTELAASCRNKGAFPVLVGAHGERDCMLASPIILYDYPEIAPESAGELFDSTEIDEILTLRIMTMTDQEKREMRAIDDRARKILERTEIMSEEELLRMHGTIRGLERGRQASNG
jgi:hydrogenase maturation protease